MKKSLMLWTAWLLLTATPLPAAPQKELKPKAQASPTPSETVEPTAVPSPAATPNPEASPVPFDPKHLKGKSGFGVGYSQHGTSLDFRQWTADNFAWGILGWATYSGANSYYDFTGKNVSAPAWNFALGLEFKGNLSHPIDDVFVQFYLIPNLSQYHMETAGGYYTGLDGVTTANSKTITERYTASLFLGPGFEAFLPFWKNISLEGNVGLILSLNWTDTFTTWNPARYNKPDSRATGAYVGADFQQNGFNLFNAYIHLYF